MKLNKAIDLQHFISRFGIGHNCQQRLTKLDENVSSLLKTYLSTQQTHLSQPQLTPLEDIIDLFIKDRKTPDLIETRRKEANQLTAWWLEQIHHTQQPLQERMTLFWHNHFTTSANKVQWPQLIYRQHLLLRKHALGNFAELLRDICNDPAMLIYLDAGKNIAKKPNENFARELLELFTLGEGYYNESDIVNVARAFTGKRYSLKEDNVIFLPKQHDKLPKEFLGKTGNFTSDDIIKILLDNPRTAEFIAEKFWLNFINPNKPEQIYIKDWAKKFRESGYDIQTLLAVIIDSPAFWKSENRGSFIKSPIEFTIGLLRELGLKNFNSYLQLSKINSRLGQRLFYPPDVKGWRGGDSWLDNGSFVIRQNFIKKIMHDYADMMQMNFSYSQLNIDVLSACLLPLSPIHALDSKQQNDKQLLALLSDPVYQLR